jgi:hypothetical protein
MLHLPVAHGGLLASAPSSSYCFVSLATIHHVWTCAAQGLETDAAGATFVTTIDLYLVNCGHDCGRNARLDDGHVVGGAPRPRSGLHPTT